MAQTFGLDAARVVARTHEQVRGRLHEPGRPAHELRRMTVRWPPGRGEHPGADPAGRYRPPRRGCPGIEVGHVEASPGAFTFCQFFGVQRLARVADRVHQPERRRTAFGRAGSDHCHQRHDAAAAGHKQHRRRGIGIPDEPPANRPAQLQRVTDGEHLRQVWGHLAVSQPLHGQLDPVAVGRGRDRIGPLRGVPVRRGQPDVHVLPGPVSGPAGDVKNNRAGGGGLVPGRRHRSHTPRQSPKYRCSRHGSP